MKTSIYVVAGITIFFFFLQSERRDIDIIIPERILKNITFVN
jgi:hypothetical protein